jgi:hypothetical protein
MITVILLVLLFACYAEFLEQLYANDKVAYDLIIIVAVLIALLTISLF